MKHYQAFKKFNIGIGEGSGGGGEFLNLHNGNHVFVFNDFSLPFYNFPLMLKRYHNSLCDVKGIFGNGWHSTFELKLIESGSDFKYIDHTGAEWLFVSDGLGGWTRPAGLFAELAFNGVDEYTLTHYMTGIEMIFKHDTVYGGYFIERIENPVGVQQVFTYEEDKVIQVEVKHKDCDKGISKKLVLAYSNGLVTSVTEIMPDGTNGRIQYYNYDGNYNLIKVILPNSDACEFKYEATSQVGPKAFVDYNGNMTQYTYIAAGNNELSSRKNLTGQTYSFAYTAAQTTETDPLSNNWVHNFAANATKTSLVTPGSKTYSWTYNSDFLVLTSVLPGPITSVTNTYDTRGFLLTTTDALSKQYTFTWVNDVLTNIQDPNLHNIVMTYNSNRQLLTRINQESEQVTLTYDNMGNLVQIQDPKGFKTKVEYNLYGLPRKTINPVGQENYAVYSPNYNNIVRTGQTKGSYIDLAYDEIGRIIKRTYPNGLSMNYTYDGSDLIDMTSTIGSCQDKAYKVSTVNAIYDTAHKMVSVSAGKNNTTTYEYDKAGRRTALLGRDGKKRVYGYDSDGNLTSMAVDGLPTDTYAFENTDQGWRSKVTYPNNWYAEYDRNDRGQITKITVKDPLAASQHEIDYSYDNLAQISQIDEQDMVAVEQSQRIITRDNIGRLTQEARTSTGGTWGNDWNLQLTFDANSNIERIQNTFPTIDKSLGFDALNRNVFYSDATASEKMIASFGAGDAPLARDFGSSGLETFAFNNIGVLKQLVTPAGDAVSFTYNSLTQLANLKVGTTRDSDFNYDSYRRIGEFERNSGQWKYYYWCLTRFYGYEDNNNKYYIVPDALGSTVVIIDGTSNSIVNRIEYDMLGNIKNETTTPQVELLFRKRPYLSTADLYINRSGLYFPQTGNEGVPVLDFYHGDSDDDRCSIEWSEYGTPAGDDCPEGKRCNYHTGECMPIDLAEWEGGGGHISEPICYLVQVEYDEPSLDEILAYGRDQLDFLFGAMDDAASAIGIGAAFGSFGPVAAALYLIYHSLEKAISHAPENFAWTISRITVSINTSGECGI